MNTTRKRQGFRREKLIVTPKTIMDNIITNTMASQLYITDIGFFPDAKFHYRERLEGSEQFILLFCVKGKGKIAVEDTEYDLSQNQLTILPANKAHLYYADKINPWSVYWIHFNGIIAPSYYEYILKGNNCLNITPLKHSHLIYQFEQMYHCLEKGYSIDNIIYISNLLSVFLSSLVHDLTLNESEESFEEMSYINKCIDYMHENILEQITLDDLANTVSLTPNYLIQHFKETTGYSPIDYFIHLKMQRACLLLDTTKKNIKEIAKILGYSDPYYFSRIFKKHISLSPKNYRLIKKG